MTPEKPSEENVPIRRVYSSAVLEAPEREVRLRAEDFHLNLAPSGGH